MAPKTVAVRDLVGIAEVAEIIGVTRSSARVYRVQGLLPPTLTELACGPIWDRNDIEKWEANRRARTAENVA
jgi:predicted site-specific integrase-resolvase